MAIKHHKIMWKEDDLKWNNIFTEVDTKVGVSVRELCSYHLFIDMRIVYDLLMSYFREQWFVGNIDEISNHVKVLETDIRGTPKDIILFNHYDVNWLVCQGSYLDEVANRSRKEIVDNTWRISRVLNGLDPIPDNSGIVPISLEHINRDIFKRGMRKYESSNFKNIEESFEAAKIEITNEIKNSMLNTLN